MSRLSVPDARVRNDGHARPVLEAVGVDARARVL
jgi:hypothetical protein